MNHYAQVSAQPILAPVRPASTWVGKVRRGVWSFLTEVGRRRARAELLRVADSVAIGQPGLAAQLRACALEGERKARGSDGPTAESVHGLPSGPSAASGRHRVG